MERGPEPCPNSTYQMATPDGYTEVTATATATANAIAITTAETTYPLGSAPGIRRRVPVSSAQVMNSEDQMQGHVKLRSVEGATLVLVNISTETASKMYKRLFREGDHAVRFAISIERVGTRIMIKPLDTGNDRVLEEFVRHGFGPLFDKKLLLFYKKID